MHADHAGDGTGGVESVCDRPEPLPLGIGRPGGDDDETDLLAVFFASAPRTHEGSRADQAEDLETQRLRRACFGAVSGP